MTEDAKALTADYDEVRDITIIGAGPVGLAAAFWAGMREASSRIIDSLPEIGGQLTTLYPEKWVFDVVGHPRILAKDLVEQLREQALEQFDVPVHLETTAETISWEDGLVVLHTERGKLRSRTVIIAGGRDYDPEELEFIAANGMLLVSAQELARDLTKAAEKIGARLAGHKVHVSFDIDVLDPAFAPGTEIPSAGGLSTRQALDLVRTATEGATLVGLDIVEVSPPFDSGDITTFAALKMIFEVWGMSWNARHSAQHVSERHGKR